MHQISPLNIFVQQECIVKILRKRGENHLKTNILLYSDWTVEQLEYSHYPNSDGNEIGLYFLVQQREKFASSQS